MSSHRSPLPILARAIAVLITSALAFALPSVGAHAADGEGNISGTVTATGGGPLTDICVEVWQYRAPSGGAMFASPMWTAGISTSSSGTYSFTTLANGEYYVTARDCVNGTYAETYNGGAESFFMASTIYVYGSTPNTVDLEMSLGGNITGTITDSAGAPVENACFTAYMASSGMDTLVGARSNASGAFSFQGLAAGQYVVSHSTAADCADWYIPGDSYWAGAGQPTTGQYQATKITVTAGQTTGGINFGASSSGTGGEACEVAADKTTAAKAKLKKAQKALKKANTGLAKAKKALKAAKKSGKAAKIKAAKKKVAAATKTVTKAKKAVTKAAKALDKATAAETAACAN